MSDTPRTDERERNNGNVLCGSANLDFARKLERELTAVQIGAARYEYLRRLNPREYQDLWKECTRNDLNFDAEVDRRRIPA